MDHQFQHALLSVCLLCSAPAQSITNTDLILSNNTPQYLAKIKTYLDDAYLPCTGTVIAKNWVLTAAHCIFNHDQIIEDNEIHFHQDQVTSSEYILVHPEYHSRAADVALIHLADDIKTNQIVYLSKKHLNIGQPISIIGFGHSDQARIAKMKLFYKGDADSTSNWQYQLSNIGQGSTEKGDSGSPYLIGNRLVGVHNGQEKINQFGYGYGAFGSQIHQKKIHQFITETIDGWHYPSHVKMKNKTTIWIQSLHKDATIPFFYTQ